MRLKYKIKFLDYWHLSSGLSAGAKLDSTVVKDRDGLPYLSGKTFKGLAREMAELLENEIFIKKCFGDEGIEMGSCYFSNATLNAEITKEIKDNALQERLYDVIASTKIGQKEQKGETKGIAVDNSLREIEVVVPVTVEGYIDDLPSKYKEQMIQALKMIKRMGLNRNRGLGRCEITVKEVV